MDPRGGVAEAMTEHVSRVEALEAIARLNELERIVPILRSALAQIEANDRGAHAVARLALQEADRKPKGDE